MKCDLREVATNGKPTVTPKIAGDILGCDPWSLSLTAKRAYAAGDDRIGTIRFVFVGRSLKINKRDLLDFVGYEGAIA